MPSPQKITTFLWANNNAEEMMSHYLSIFKNSKVLSINRCGDGGPRPKGSVLTVAFELEGQRFTAVNGGPQFPFTEAISLVVHCDTQDEIDYYWDKLSQGGTPGRCCWLKDKFGLSWQVFPHTLIELIKDPAKAGRAMGALMQMNKPDLAAILAACATH